MRAIICAIVFVCIDIGILYAVRTYDQDKPRKHKTKRSYVLYDPESLS